MQPPIVEHGDQVAHGAVTIPTVARCWARCRAQHPVVGVGGPAGLDGGLGLLAATEVFQHLSQVCSVGGGHRHRAAQQPREWMVLDPGDLGLQVLQRPLVLADGVVGQFQVVVQTEARAARTQLALAARNDAS